MTSFAPKPSPSPDRNGALDLLRFVGALGIIWFHLRLPGGAFALGALHIFTTFAVYFGLDRPTAERARRLLIPWVIWSLIYGALKLADGWVGGQGIKAEFALWMLLTGPAIHLWFLPIAFAVPLLLANLSVSHVRLSLLPLTFAAIAIVNLAPLPVPLPQWISILPAVWLGLAMRSGLTPGPAFAVTALAAVMALTGWQIVAIPLATGALAMGVILALPPRALPLSRQAAGLSLGLYLAHPMVAAVLLRAGISNTALLFFLTVAGSALIVLALKRLLPAAV